MEIGEVKGRAFAPSQYDPQRTQRSTDYQGLAEFKALTLRVNCDEAKFDT